MQYTVRRVPRALDAALRRRAREQGKSLNAVALETLLQGAGVVAEKLPRRDLKDIAGEWRQDPDFDKAIAEQHKIDKALWK